MYLQIHLTSNFWSDASSIWPMRSSCKYHRSQISLNIHFKGIHALGIFFSVNFYEKRDQNEISTTTLKFGLSMEVTLVTPLWGAINVDAASDLGSTSNTEHTHTHTMWSSWQVRKLRLLPPELWYTIKNQYLVIAARLWQLDHKTSSPLLCPELTCNKVKSYTTCGGYMG